VPHSVETVDSPQGITRSGEPIGAANLAVLTAAVALIAALVYVLTAAGKIWVMGSIANVSRDLVWMTPLSNLFWYFIGWVGLVLIGRVLGRQRGFHFGVWCLSATFVFSLFLRFTAIHRLAALIFAAGLATVMLGIYRRNPWRWLQRARLARNTLAVMFIVAGVAIPLRDTLARRRAVASLPEPAAGSPNVILIVLDAMRGDILQTAGYGRRVTPFLDSLAATGAIFTHAYSTAPWTLPSHGTLFTGQYPNLLNATFTEPLDGTFPTIAEQLAANGYYTFGLTANLHYTSWESGIDRGFVEWRDFKRSIRQLLRSSEIGQIQMILEIIDATSWRDVVAAIRRHMIYVHPKPESHVPVAGEITDQLLSWHDRRPRRPFLAFVNYYDAHWTYNPPAAYRQRFSDEPGLRDLYDGEVNYIDDELRRLFRELERRGALDSTFVIITSDHGELFGERGRTEHGNSLYAPVLRVPLILVGPGIGPRRVERAVSLRDLPATILQLTGAAGTFPGVSLTGHLADTSFQSSPVLSWYDADRGQWQAYLDDEFHLIRRPGAVELYRYRSDSVEAIDLAGVDSLRPQLLRLGEAMDRAIAEHASPPKPTP
jgi:arylsulfatase A-like enzyme